jgi:tetratricopeptide (TPR) repeat protein
MDSSKLNAFAHHQPVVLFGLLIIAILGFWGVANLVGGFAHHQQVLAKDLFQQGETEIQNHQLKLAVVSLRAALSFDPDNYQYELKLAQALTDQQRYDEAHAYLINLWDTMPQDGEVNLQLARIAAIRGSRENTLRYYHNAIYGIWSDNAEVRHRQARLELINYLLANNDLTQARAELIASAAALPPDPGLHTQFGDLFTRAQDYTDALAQYREALKLDRKNPAALVGAAKSAFRLGQYRTAQRYFQLASAQGKLDPDAEQMFKSASLVLESDPYHRGISDAERRARITRAFQAAGDRLQDCAKTRGEDLTVIPASTPLQTLESDWLELKPKFRLGRIVGGDDTTDAAMDLVFRIEQQTQTECGNPAGLDLALLYLSNDRQGAER